MSYFSLTKCMFPSPEIELLESVKNNEIDAIKTLIQSNNSLLTYVYPVTSKTIFLTACSERKVNSTTIQTLIDLKADIKGNAKWKPLHLAAENPNSAILKIIITMIGTKQINETVKWNTALHSLIKGKAIDKENEHEFCENIARLLREGINVNQGDYKDLSAIFWAAKEGYKNVVKTILETSLDHVDLDSHTLDNKSARDYIEEKNLYDGSLPERILIRCYKDQIFSFIKHAQEDKAIEYFERLLLTKANAFVNWDDGTWTLLQHCCEKGFLKAAEYLLQKGADRTKIINETEKAPLDIVAENGYYEILKMLVKDRTDVKLPLVKDHTNLKLSSISFCHLIKQSDNPKLGNINHEKCCKIILEKLESGGINLDVNAKDELKNNPIHYSLRYADEATTLKLLKLGASLAWKNYFVIMPIEYIKPELLERHLDHCGDEKKENGDSNSKFSFDYRSLLPPKKLKKGDGSDPESGRECSDDNNIVPETEVIAYMSKAPELQHLLKHPVIVSFLLMKWHRICLLFYANLLLFILFVVFLMVHILTSYADFDQEKPCHSFPGQSKWSLSWYTLSVMFCILALIEICLLFVSLANYFKNLESYVKILLIIITGMILYIDSPTDDTKKQCASIAILLAALELVLMGGLLYLRLSTNVVMLKTVSLNFFKLLLWHSLLIIAFGFSFSILFTKTEEPQTVNLTKEEKKDMFRGYGKSIFKTIVMMTGEFDSSSINFDPYPIVSRLIFILFVFMIPIILMNKWYSCQ